MYKLLTEQVSNHSRPRDKWSRPFRSHRAQGKRGAIKHLGTKFSCSLKPLQLNVSKSPKLGQTRKKRKTLSLLYRESGTTNPAITWFGAATIFPGNEGNIWRTGGMCPASGAASWGWICGMYGGIWTKAFGDRIGVGVGVRCKAKKKILPHDFWQTFPHRLMRESVHTTVKIIWSRKRPGMDRNIASSSRHCNETEAASANCASDVQTASPRNSSILTKENCSLRLMAPIWKHNLRKPVNRFSARWRMVDDSFCLNRWKSRNRVHRANFAQSFQC